MHFGIILDSIDIEPRTPIAGIPSLQVVGDELIVGRDYKRYYIFLPHRAIGSVSDVIKFIGKVTVGLLATVYGGPLAPIVSAFMTAYAATIVSMDKGNGMWLKVTWLAPTLLVPSSAQQVIQSSSVG